MKRRLISYICLITIFMEYVPVNALSNITSEVITSQSTEESKQTQKSTEQKDNAEVKDVNSQAIENKSKLEDNVFNIYILDEEERKNSPEIGFSIGFNEKEDKFKLSNQSEKQLSKQNLNTVIYKINIYDKNNKEKLNIELLGSDTGKSEKLNVLKDLKYEIGDTIKITSIDPKNGLKILGEIQGDINKDKEDYSDGVDNIDYIDNVRFRVEPTGLITIYNKAPVIKGVNDREISSFDDFNPLEGVTVEDDHDKNLIDFLTVKSESLKENQRKYTYQVTDTWGRSTEATRIITLKKINSKSERTSQTSLSDNVISVRGIKFGTDSRYGDAQTRFKIIFDEKSRRIKVIDQDGRSMNSRINDTYFKMTLYDSKGNIKKHVEINGDDRSDTSKLDELRFYGWSYQYGDEISIWHYEAPLKISISGNVNQQANQEEIDFTSGLTKPILEMTRFELTSLGLKHILNNPPTINFEEGDKGLVINRGEDIDLQKGVEYSDDRKVVSTKVSKGFDSTKLGDQTVVYTATDNWGFETTKERKITVVDKNEIERIFIKVKSIDGNPMFYIGFDEIKKQFILNTENSDVQLNPKNKSIELSISIFNKFNVKKREFKILGKDTINSNSIQNFMNYGYEEGDYLQIIPVDPSIVTIDGNIDGVPDNLNYSLGVDDLDKWVNVRFQLIGGKFKYKYNQAPVIRGYDNLEITRGNEINVLQGMTVNDDKDGNDIALTETNTEVTLKSGSGIFLGNQVYDIKYTDSWGRSTSVERVVVINSANPIEEQKIELFDGNKIVLSFSYDSIDKKFKVLSYDPEYSFLNSETENAFVLAFYDSNTHNKQEELVLKSEDLIDNEFLKKLTDIVVQDDWYMTLWYYDYSKIRITSANDTSNTDIIFKNDDQMENTRFNISNSGITSIYNKAPKIIGVDDVSIVYGSEFNPRQGVSVDDEDDNLEEALNISEEVDTHQLGTQILYYEVTDSYGRRTVKERTVTVVPVYTTNEVEYYNDNNEKMFSIGINNAATGFTVSIPEVMPTGNHSLNFTFKVFDTNQNEIYKLEINSTSTINEDLFSNLKSLIIRPGYFFSVDSEHVEKIKISGNLNKSSEQISSVDYSNLTSEDKDFVENVRFELTENIVKAIYNSAPEIIIQEGTEDIERNQAITLSDYNLLEGLSIEDDKDDLSVDKIEIKLPDSPNILTTDLDEAKALIGQTVTITYQVADNWGRLSSEFTRNLTIKSAMDDMHLQFLYAPTGGQLGNLVPNPDNVSLNIRFNMETGRINLEEGNRDTFKGNYIEYGAFAILDKDNNVKVSHVFGTDRSFDNNDSIFGNADISNNVRDVLNNINANQNRLESQGRKTVEYGDKLIVRTYQSPFLYIYGNVINSQEDYSKGANLNSILVNSKFEITPAGLKQIYDGPTMNSGDFSQLTLYNIVSGTQSLNMYLDNSNQSNLIVKADLLDNEWLQTIGTSSENLLKLQINRPDGSTLKTHTYVERTRPQTVVNDFNNTVVEEGAYLTLNWNSPLKIKNSKLYNLPGQYGFPVEVDYSGDITEETYFNDVRFYFTRYGIIPMYNSAPTFQGIEDISISLGEQFNPRDGVYVKDDHDIDISSYTVDGTVDQNRVGEYTLTYSAVDSWGRVGTYQRKVYVKPKIHENHFEFYTKDNQKSFSIDFDPDLYQDTDDGVFKISKFSDDLLDVDRASEQVLRIGIYSEYNTLKKEITLLGRDTSDSNKLNELNDFAYENGDYIRVWRAQSLNASDSSIEGIKIIGNINGDTVNFASPQKGIDYMTNTVFYIKSTGLEACYNDAPILTGVSDRVIYYGDTNYNLLSGVNVNDAEDGESLTVSVTPSNINTNILGTTQVTYSVTDSFGRTTSQLANVIVRSKTYLNQFEICKELNDEIEEQKFYIGFNPNVNAFTFYNSAGEVSVDGLDVSIIPSDLNIVLYNRLGREKVNIQFLESDNVDQKKEKLRQLQSITVSTFDMINIITSQYSRVRIKGNVVNNTNYYENGFDSEEAMRNVRFQVTNQGLTEIHRVLNNAVTFDGLTPLTIKRGDQVNLLDNVSVNHPNEIITELSVSDFDNMKVGMHTVTYSAQDSWGTTFTAERNIEVLPFNDLEKVRITVSDTDTTELIKVKFDAIESTLSYDLEDTSSLVYKLRKVLSFARSLPEDTVVLKVSTFNKDMVEMDSISISKSDILTTSLNLEELNRIPFVVGGFIGIDIYDFTNENALSISGPVNYPDESKNYYQDMKHVRYYINEDGIEAIYNEAPEVTAKNEVELKIAEDFDLKKVLTINDDRDSLEFIKVKFSEYDPYEVGKYEVTATVIDSWGLDTKVTFNVYVLSYLDDNAITLKSDTDKEILTIRFKSKTGKLVIDFNEENDEVQIISSSTDNIINFNIYDENQNLIDTIPINGNDTVETIKQKLLLGGFINYSYHYNYFIGLNVIENAKQLIKITNVKKENDGYLGSVDYENGVTNIDYFNNVRFELNPYGLAAIYNEAPIINYDLGTKLAVKSLDVEDYNLLDGVSIVDDKDKLDVENIDIKYNDSDDPSELTLGSNTITLTIRDNWGRESSPVTFNLELSSAMNDIGITFLYAADGLIPDFNKKSAVLTFDMDEGKILVNNSTQETYQDKFKFNLVQYGAFGVYNENNELIFKSVLGEDDRFEEDNSEFKGATRYNSPANFKAAIERINIQYGYKIKIKMYQSPFVYIDGKVINAQEDYSEGAYLSEILNTSTFTITEEGLVQNYDEVEVEPGQNDIVWLSGVAGDKLFTINVNPETRMLEVTKHSGEPLDTLYKDSSPLFSIDVYNAQGVHSYGIDANTRQNADNIVSALDGQQFEIGGYMTIKIKPTDRNRMRNMKIYGNIDKSLTPNLEDVDFSEEIKDVAYFNESRFYFTENGLALSYNEAPAFSGLTDIMLLSDDNLEPVNLRENVQVYDDNTENIEYSIEDVNGNIIENQENYIPPSLGAHELFYVAEDSMGRVTREPRFIWFQSASRITVRDESLLTVQEANPNLQTDEDIMQYLIDLVTVTDEEDDENNKSINITENNIKGTFNPNEPGVYPIEYTVQDSDGNITKETFDINVVRTISVSAPIYIPFQVVTNLIKNTNDSSSELDPFVSGIMNVSNNYLTNVEVYVKEFTKQSDTGELEIVNPNRFANWNDLTETETMKYMALGIYNKNGFENSSYTKDNPLWLETSINDIYIGRLAKATDLNTPNIAKLSFVSKHGNKFIGGRTKGKFNLILEFR